MDRSTGEKFFDFVVVVLLFSELVSLDGKICGYYSSPSTTTIMLLRKFFTSHSFQYSTEKKKSVRIGFWSMSGFMVGSRYPRLTLIVFPWYWGWMFGVEFFISSSRNHPICSNLEFDYIVSEMQISCRQNSSAKLNSSVLDFLQFAQIAATKFQLILKFSPERKTLSVQFQSSTHILEFSTFSRLKID